MSFSKSTDAMSELIETIMSDLPKAHKGNKSAAQRVRCATIQLSKTSKEWRKLSLILDKKDN